MTGVENMNLPVGQISRASPERQPFLNIATANIAMAPITAPVMT